MESLLQEITWKVVTAVLSGIIIGILSQTVSTFVALRKTMKTLLDVVKQVDERLEKVEQTAKDTHIRVSNPNNWGLGNRETNELLRDMIREMNELNTNIVRLLTIVERNGVLRSGGG